MSYEPIPKKQPAPVPKGPQAYLRYDEKKDRFIVQPTAKGQVMQHCRPENADSIFGPENAVLARKRPGEWISLYKQPEAMEPDMVSAVRASHGTDRHATSEPRDDAQHPIG